jgi:hypothetical protein
MYEHIVTLPPSPLSASVSVLTSPVYKQTFINTLRFPCICISDASSNIIDMLKCIVLHKKTTVRGMYKILVLLMYYLATCSFTIFLTFWLRSPMMVLPNLYTGVMNKHNMIAKEVHELKKQLEITNLVTLRLDNDIFSTAFESQQCKHCRSCTKRKVANN